MEGAILAAVGGVAVLALAYAVANNGESGRDWRFLRHVLISAYSREGGDRLHSPCSPTVQVYALGIASAAALRGQAGTRLPSKHDNIFKRFSAHGLLAMQQAASWIIYH